MPMENIFREFVNTVVNTVGERILNRKAFLILIKAGLYSCIWKWFPILSETYNSKTVVFFQCARMNVIIYKHLNPEGYLFSKVTRFPFAPWTSMSWGSSELHPWTILSSALAWKAFFRAKYWFSKSNKIGVSMQEKLEFP